MICICCVFSTSLNTYILHTYYIFSVHRYATTTVHCKIYHCRGTFSQAYNANELWHFPRQIIIPSRSIADAIISSDPTKTSRIRRIELLLTGLHGGRWHKKCLPAVPLYPCECWHASMYYRYTFSPVLLSFSSGTHTIIYFISIHQHTRHHRFVFSDQQLRTEISDKD